MTDFPLKNYIPAIESALNGYLPEIDSEYAVAVDAMRYAALGGGKRIRPSLLLEIYRMLGGNTGDVMPLACALEMIHTYSLIHDDLPCMDNDDFRRGKPSLHKAFSESTALLAGDALLTLAFRTAAECAALQPSAVLRCISLLAEKAGVNGMIGGQIMDLDCGAGSSGRLFNEKKNRLKTGALFSLCGEIPVALAGADDRRNSLIREYCDKIGYLFQTVDDILDGDLSPVGTGGETRAPDLLCGEAQAMARELGNDALFRLPGYILNRER